MIRNIFVTLFITLLFNNIAEAGCKNDIDFSWSKDYNKTNLLNFKFKNNGSKFVRITRVYVNDSDGDKISDIKIKKSSKSVFSVGLGRTFVNPYKEYTWKFGNSSAYTYGKTAGYECKYQKPYENSLSDNVGSAVDSVGDALSDLNPLNYFEKRKQCLRRKDNADTVAIGKRIYKNCMEGN